MKKTFIQLLMLSVVILTSPSCKKNNQKPKIEIEETDLTDCWQGMTCSYLFEENVDGNWPSKAGNYRLFTAEFNKPGMVTRVSVKAPMEGTEFLLNKQDVIAGRAQEGTLCSMCLMMAGVKNIDGYVKGVNLTPDKPFNESKWLLQIEIIRGVDDLSWKGTTYIKQYFYPKAN